MKAASTNESYPATQAELGLPSSSNDLRYIYDIGTNTYCIQSKKNNASYFATSINPAPRQGLCINAPESMIGCPHRYMYLSLNLKLALSSGDLGDGEMQ